MEQKLEPQSQNELPTKPESEPQVIKPKSVDEPHIEAEIEPQIETDVQTKIETEPPAEPEHETKTEPSVEPEIEIGTEPPAIEPKFIVETEPVEPEPPVESDESNESEDSNYIGSLRSESITSEFDDTDFSVEDMFQFRVDVGIDFKGNVRVPPSVGKGRIDSESEIEVSYTLHSQNELDSESGKKKKQRFPEFNSETDMDNLELKVVVDSENHSSWCWFLEILAKDLELTKSHYVSFMTDKQKGLVEGLPGVFPHSEHRTCVRHLYMNFKLRFIGKALKVALWKAARATYSRELEVALSEIEALSPKAHEWCWPTHAGAHKFQVSCGPYTQHAVDLSEHTCSCKK
ncbi:hypothetical protein V6N13_072619 [Hibiscus sabdariffa]